MGTSCSTVSHCFAGNEWQPCVRTMLHEHVLPAWMQYYCGFSLDDVIERQDLKMVLRKSMAKVESLNH